MTREINANSHSNCDELQPDSTQNTPQSVIHIYQCICTRIKIETDFPVSGINENSVVHSEC
jgi:hypothetical protein